MPTLLGSVIDRVAIAIGRRVITETQIDEELRVTAFLNRQPVNRSLSSRRDAADRLVQQFLIRREIELSRFPGANPAELANYVTRVETQYGEASEFAAALRSYALNRETLRSHLSLQLETMRFIDFRFRPEFTGSPAEIERGTDDALNIWLEEARKRVNIVYLDGELR